MVLSAPVKRLPAAFYRTAAGGEPVRDWLKALSGDDRKAVGDDLRLLEFGWPVGMPMCRAMGEGLWEVRTNLEGGRGARVLFCIEQGHAVLLHGFFKTARRTPKRELDTAQGRRTDLRRRRK
jgi:phage-related protein